MNTEVDILVMPGVMFDLYHFRLQTAQGCQQKKQAVRKINFGRKGAAHRILMRKSDSKSKIPHDPKHDGIRVI